MKPFDKTPQVEHDESNADIEKANNWRSRSGASSDLVHQTVAGFDAKTKPIFLIDLQRMQFQITDNDIGKAENTLAFVAALGILTDDMNGKGYSRVDGAVAGIGGNVAFSSFQKCPSTALFAADFQRDNDRESFCLEIVDNRIIIKIGRAHV